MQSGVQDQVGPLAVSVQAQAEGRQVPGSTLHTLLGGQAFCGVQPAGLGSVHVGGVFLGTQDFPMQSGVQVQA